MYYDQRISLANDKLNFLNQTTGLKKWLEHKHLTYNWNTTPLGSLSHIGLHNIQHDVESRWTSQIPWNDYVSVFNSSDISSMVHFPFCNYQQILTKYELQSSTFLSSSTFSHDFDIHTSLVWELLQHQVGRTIAKCNAWHVMSNHVLCYTKHYSWRMTIDCLF